MSSFNNISIIGLGLIGSSIAQAAKKYNACEHISAFDLNTDSINKAIELGIIDYGFDSLSNLVKNSDLVILCTPLGTYGEIIKQIAPSLKKDAIITDVGSVKSYAIEVISKHIKQPENFVPAHPIAGSEKSGLLAGNADLFLNKEAIITPTLHSSKDAIAKITEFWQEIGSNVEEMNSANHDNIYATSSHIPHFISFCYAKLLVKYYNKPLEQIVKNEGDEFAAFVRLAYSNPQMWTDIFLYNKEPIIRNIEQYFTTPSLKSLDNDREIRGMANRISQAKLYRESFEGVVKFSKKMDSTNAITGFLPKVIACLTIESVSGSKKVGGGFLGLTANIKNLERGFTEALIKDGNSYNNLIQLIYTEIKTLLEYIKASDKENIRSYISSII